MDNAHWELLLYLFDDVYVNVVVGGGKALLDLLWLELAARVTDLLWEKGCSCRRTSSNAGRAAILTVEWRCVRGIGVGNVMRARVDRRRVVGGPAPTGGEHCASCVALAVFVGVCEKPLWWMAGEMGWFDHDAG